MTQVNAGRTRGLHGAAETPEPLSCSAVLTHHWLVRIRGGERVLEALAGLLPSAPVYTLVYDRAGLAESPLAGRELHGSLLQHLPGVRGYYPKLLPILGAAARAVKLPRADLVVCSDASVAKAMRADRRSRTVCYCHSPMRYLYEEDVSRAYRQQLPAPVRPLWRALTAGVRRTDLAAARDVDVFVANSQTVAARIQRHYGRASLVVYPPVDVPDAPARGRRESFYLCVGHHVPYKRLELAVRACAQLERRLVVIGDGPDVARLRDQAGGGVTWLGYQPRAVIADHYRRAAALLFPGEEDFGMVPVEALGHGCPVVAYGRGGATETVTPGLTGVLFDEASARGLAEAIEQCEQSRFDPDVLHEHARRFGRARFLREMRAALVTALAGGRW